MRTAEIHALIHSIPTVVFTITEPLLRYALVLRTSKLVPQTGGVYQQRSLRGANNSA